MRKASFELKNNTLICQGDWTRNALGNMAKKLKQLDLSKLQKLDGDSLQKLDSAGAWLLACLCANQTLELVLFNKSQQKLISLIQQQVEPVTKQNKIKHKERPILDSLGYDANQALLSIISFLAFFGETCVNVYKLSLTPWRVQWRLMWVAVYEAGFQALGIIALLTFLVGVVLAYQMALQLRLYGADIFIVELSGMALVREFAPLITAIIVAGRTSSAFTAQIGTMKINAEVDALYTMGLSPNEWLVLPKILALCICIPLLTVWADMFGVLGSMVMSNNMLDISYLQFIHRFHSQIAFSDYGLGIIKAPVFALIIGLLGCFQGFQVGASAESVGRSTTKSVVQSIFFIIVADAIFSVIFSWQGI